MSGTPTLVFLDSFDHYDTNHILYKWTTGGGVIGTFAGRNGQGLETTGIAKTVPPQSNFTVGWAIKINIGEGLGGVLWQLQALGAGGSLIVLAQLTIGGDGTFILWAGNNAIGNPKTFVYTNSTWMYVEVFCQLGGATPITVNMDLHVNGNDLGSFGGATNVTLAGLLLQNQPMGDYHFFGGGVDIGSTYIDDLYIGTGGGYFGDVRIGCIYPRADVSLSNFAPSSGSQGWPMLNEHPSPSYSGPSPDDDSTYIFDDLVSDEYTALFNMITNLTDETQAVQLDIYARKDDEGSRAITPVIGTLAGLSDVYFWLGDNYCYHTFPYTTDPNGGAWSPELINTTPFGLEIVE